MSGGPVNYGRFCHLNGDKPSARMDRQVKSGCQIRGMWTMDDEDDAWESLGDVVARLLRKIEPRGEAA